MATQVSPSRGPVREDLRQFWSKGLDSEFNGHGFVDAANNEVYFKFNIQVFDVDLVSFDAKRREVMENTKIFKDGKMIGRTGVVIQQNDLGDFKDMSEGEMLEGGYYINFSITIGKNQLNKRSKFHTTAHELGHYMLIGSPVEDLGDMDTPEKHEMAGGIFKYGQIVKSITKHAISSGTDANETISYSIEGTEKVNQDNVNKILQSVIDIGSKEVVEQEN
ncbi:MAG TPA: hypothetical protein VD816_16780 [Ohtaekwangia sp.]|nr:hypothetical protein [Ohtaekwangia sp.]